MTATDYVLDFKLVTDSELEHHQRVLQYGKEKEPIATQLKKSATESESYLNVYLFSRANNNLTDISPESLWRGKYPYPDTDSEIHLLDKDRVKGIGFSIQLTDIAHDNSVNWLVEKIAEHRTKLVGS